MNARELFAIALLILGSTITYLYLYTVEVADPPISFLFLGVSFQSLAIFSIIFLLIKKREISIAFLVIFLCILSLSVCFTGITRFGTGAQGDDLRAEIKVAQATYANERWNSSLEKFDKYASCLSVTIFPAILSKVIGISIHDTFLYVMRLLAASMPIFVFVVINSVTKNRTIAFLSALLLTLNYFFFSMAVNLMKTTLAVIFSLLLFYCLFQENRKYTLLAIFFSLGVITSHYNTIYFTAFVLLSFSLIPLSLSYVIPKKFKASMKQEFSTSNLLLLFFIMIFTWQNFSSPITFRNEVVGTIIDLWLHLQNLLFGYKGIETSYVLSSPRGLVITIWFDLQIVLMGIGGLFALYNLFQGKKVKGKEINWILAGCSLLGLFFVWFVLPVVSVAVSPFRVVYLSVPFFSYFLALIILKVGKSRFWPFAMLFLVLMLPMNMMLPSHQNDLVYHPQSTLQPERVMDALISFYMAKPGENVAEWASVNIQEKIIKVDDLGGGYLRLASFPLTIEIQNVHYPKVSHGEYLLIHDFYVGNGLWATGIDKRNLIFEPEVKVDPNSFYCTPLNLIYDSNRYTLVYFPNEGTS